MTSPGGGDGWTGSAEAPRARRVHSAQEADRERRVRRLQVLADLMDSAFVVPGTNLRFGLDPILGLAPGVGDLATNAIALYIVYQGWRLGATKKQMAMMLANVAVDTVMGAVPVAGDMADFVFKANRRNLAILGIAPLPGAAWRGRGQGAGWGGAGSARQ